jgi:hypothetical protein
VLVLAFVSDHAQFTRSKHIFLLFGLEEAGGVVEEERPVDKGHGLLVIQYDSGGASKQLNWLHYLS